MDIRLIALVAGICIVGVALLFIPGAQESVPAPLDVFMGRPTEADIMVIGVPSADLVGTLSGREAQVAGIKYPINFDPGYVTLDMLKQFEAVILQGDPYFDMNVREAIRDYVDGGGKLIVVGDAGSKHPEYDNVAGWGWPKGEGIPVPATLIGEWAGWSDIAYGAELRLVSTTHPITESLQIMGSSLNVPSQVFKTISKGNTLIAIDTSEGTVPAVIEGTSGLGRVVYFAYDPGQTPEILLTTVRYMTGV